MAMVIKEWEANFACAAVSLLPRYGDRFFHFDPSLLENKYAFFLVMVLTAIS